MGLTSTQIFDAVTEIGLVSSKNEKQALVAEYGKDEMFKRILLATFSPLITYGISKRPEAIGVHGTKEFTEDTFKLLTELEKRVLTGQAAIDAVAKEMTLLNEKSATLLWRIIKKDLRAGFGDSTINKAFKGFIPEFPYMRCSLPKDANLEDWPWEFGVISQEKADGMFANIDHEIGGLVRITSRQGTEFPIDKFPEVVDEIRSRLTPNTQYHGEFLVERDGVVLERALSNGVMNSIANGGDFEPNERPIYKVWDAIELTSVVSKGKFTVPYNARLGQIIKDLSKNYNGIDAGAVSLIPTRIVRSLKDAYTHAAVLMKEGKEGTIIKHPTAIWRDGTSKEQIKLKLEFDVDLVVKEIVPGEADTRNEGRAGSLLCETSDGLLRVNVTVKNEDMRNRVDANPEDWIDKIIVVKANDIIPPSESNELHSLFLPRMIEPNYRVDKTTADDLARVFSAKELAILGEQILKEAA
jgi:DNA ligase-1